MSAKMQSISILLCRECQQQQATKESEFDTDNWHPLIDGKKKRLETWLVKEPTTLEYRQSRQVKPEQISKVEEMWKEKPNADFTELIEVPAEKLYQPVLLRYRDPN